jgi:hypothetical protein
MRAMGSEFEFMNIEAAIAKLRWDFFSPNILERTLATRAEKTVTTMKKIGITHSSLSFAGFKKNATLENSRAGVNKEMLIWFITR